MQVAEAILLAGVVGLLYALLSPLRRRLERWLARHLPGRPGRARAQVVVLPRRRDGMITQNDGHGS